MGKRQHQSDKMYLTTKEWAVLFGGHKSKAPTAFRRLPLDHCCLSLVPWRHPYIDPQGNVYDLEAILPYVKKNKVNPVTGEPLSDKQLTRANFDASPQGGYRCPVLYKPLTNHCHVVCVRPTGNVYSYEAVEELNLKTKNFRDLLDDTPFTRADLITIQQPGDLDKFNITKFYHVKKGLEEHASKDTPGGQIRSMSKDTADILSAIASSTSTEYAAPGGEEAKEGGKLDKFNSAHYSTNAVAAALTSTAAAVATVATPVRLDDQTVRYARLRGKGYVSLSTSLGPLNLELYCNSVPKTCENFLRLCKDGYYDNTIFHRSIRHFMIQGGDPTGTGKGGECSWGGAFKDEFRPQFSHKGRGVLAMANSGPDTNKSQFYITYRSCVHLDQKHTIFGRLVGGLETLRDMEAVETDDKDAPISPITLLSCTVMVDPYADVDKQLAKERAAEAEAAMAEAAELRGGKRRRVEGAAEAAAPLRQGVGRFLDLSKAQLSKEEEELCKEKAGSSKPKPNATYKFSDFSVF